MDRERTQSELSSIYAYWRSHFDTSGIDLDAYSSPLLLKVTEKYCQASTKILVFGKETEGWGWNEQKQKQSPASGWHFRDQSTLRDFLQHDDSIEALLWRYH